jgi:GNAT superfamily N-acetyltransferase
VDTHEVSIDLAALATRYQNQQFVHVPGFISTARAAELLATTRDVTVKRVRCRDENVQFGQQNFDDRHPINRFFATDRLIRLALELTHSERIRAIQCWTLVYRRGEYIDPHTDRDGSIQMIPQRCSQSMTTTPPRSGRLSAATSLVAVPRTFNPSSVLKEYVMDDEYTPDTHELKDGARLTVRLAGLEDVKALHVHFLELDVVSRGLLFGNARPRNRGFVRKMVEHQEVFIALDPNGDVIGYASYEADPFDDPLFRDWAAIEMSVAVRWRRRGVGTVLLQALTGLARAAGIRRLVIETHHRNRPVITWAESHGAEQDEDPEANWHQFVKKI